MRETETANAETIFRIIQSIPSPKAEPFKRWLAKEGYGRIQEIEDPELASKRIRDALSSEIHLLDTGHFALETHGREISKLIIDFLNRKVKRSDRH